MISIEKTMVLSEDIKNQNSTILTRTPLSNHGTKEGCATFCWFYDAGSHIIQSLSITPKRKKYNISDQLIQ